MVLASCNAKIYNVLLYPLKNIMTIILIAAPILLIISLLIIFTKGLINPDDKKVLKGVKNAILATIFVFLTSCIVTVAMQIAGDSTNFSECWNKASKPKTAEYEEIEDDRERKTPTIDSDKYPKGMSTTNLEFNCKSNIIKSKFSCDTMKIVQSHYKDFNYNNYKSFMKSYGGAGKYIKNLGGVFSEYYGKSVKVHSVEEFQKVSEYVFGLLYIYGVDYYNGSKYCKWGGSCKSGSKGSIDAYYPNSMKHTSDGLSDKRHFDKMITAGKNITTNCNYTVDMVYCKAGLCNNFKGWDYKNHCKNGKVIKNVTDYQVGDVIHFFKSSINLDGKPSNWHNWYHVAFVGEVYDNKVVFYDGGSYFTNNRNFKWSIDRKNSIKKVHGTKNWAVCRPIKIG